MIACVLSWWFIWASSTGVGEVRNSRHIKALKVVDLVIYNYIVYIFLCGTSILGLASEYLSSAVVFSDRGDNVQTQPPNSI